MVFFYKKVSFTFFYKRKGSDYFGSKPMYEFLLTKLKANTIYSILNLLVRTGSNSICLITTVLLLFISATSNAQIKPLTKTDQYVITKRHFSVEDGLASREVLDAVEDRAGFMWFASNNGLCRYDGNSFKIFTKQNFGLLENEIAALTIDSKNHLIIEFNNKNLIEKIHGEIQVLDLNTNKLQTFECAYPKLPFKTKDIVCISSDENKKLIFITNNPYQVWEHTSKKGFKLIGALSKWNAIKNSVLLYSSDNSVSTIVQNGSIVLKKKNYPNYLLKENRLISFSNKQKETIFSITKSKSLLCYNSVTNTVSKSDFPVAENSFEQQNTELFLHLSTVTNYPWLFSRQHSNEGNIVYNLKKGIYYMDDKSFFLIAKPEEISNDFNFGISSTFKDSRGYYWLCTTFGVYQVALKPNHFKSYFSKRQEKICSYNQVRGIYADNSLDVNTNIKTTSLYANMWLYLCVSKTKLNKTALSYTTNTCAFNALLKHKNKFYIGGVDAVFEYEPTHNKAIEIGAFGNKLDGNYVWSLTSASDSILIAGHGNGLTEFNLITKRNKALLYKSPKIPRAKNVYRFVQTKTKGLVAVAENGLFLIDKNNIVVDYYGSLVSDKIHHLPISIIYDMQEDSNGICWIVTNGEGLFRWDWRHSESDKSIKLDQFTTAKGLPSMLLYRIEEDSDHNLWIGTNNGLLRFNTQTYSTSVYTINDGINNNEFNRTSSFKAADGIMYFGGLDGVIGFKPNELLRDETRKEPALQIIALSKFSGKENRLLDHLLDFKKTKTVLLEAGDSFFTLEFQLLDFQKRKHLYAYKIDGIDADWIYIDENTIRLSGLPYGEFKMHIKAQLANGKWNSHPIVFPIVVLKPFYLQIWFLLALMLLIVSGFVFYLRYRTYKLHKENHELELIVNSRTAALKKSLEDRELLLAEIHHRVKNNLQVISGLLELQKVELTDKSAIAAFTEGQSRVSSIALIHQNLYQNENLGSIEFCSFARDLSSKVAELFENQNNKVVFTIENKEVYFDIDTAVPLGLILNELITNSYKYFTKGALDNSININVFGAKNNTHTLVFKDNGPGIKQNVDFDTTNSLGLKLIRGLSKQLHGKATYKYENGSVFTIKFKDLVARKM